MPLRCQFGLGSRQVVKALQHLFPRAIGTAGARRAGIDFRLLHMALFALSPDLPPGAPGDILWRHRPVTGSMPLGEQFLIFLFDAMVIKALLHTYLPLSWTE